MNKTDDNKGNEPKHVFQEVAQGAYRITVLPRSVPKENLPPAVYFLNYHETQHESFYYLGPANDYKLPERIYGDVLWNVDHFFKSYCLNSENLGVLLIGERGSGKTITLKTLAHEAVKMGMPVILINQAYQGDAFLNFLTSITQNCIIAFDEFDKTYSKLGEHGQQFASKAQDSILQILDGVAASGKKLFVLTANDMGLLSKYLQDRPGRIRYVIRFKHMEVKTVEAFVKERLENFSEEHLNAFIHMALSHTDSKVGLNFDSMSSFVREMNQFQFDLKQCLEIMAVRGSETDAYYNVEIHKDGKLLAEGHATGKHFGPYLTKDKFKIDVTYFVPPEEDKPITHSIAALNETHFVGYKQERNMFELKDGDMTYIVKYIDRDAWYDRMNSVNQEMQELSNPYSGGYGGGFQRYRPKRSIAADAPPY